MTHKINDAGNTVTFSFDAGEIMKYVFAQNALHALTGADGETHPHLFSEDNFDLLNIILKNGYFNMASRLLGFVSGYDFDEIDNGIMRLDIIMPRTYDAAKIPVLQHKIEQALAFYILKEIYDTENGTASLAAVFAKEYRKSVNAVLAFFALTAE